MEGERYMDEEKKKDNKKRKVSIITVFLWLLLIVTMSVITIGSIYKQNAIEDTIDKVTIKLDISQLDEESGRGLCGKRI